MEIVRLSNSSFNLIKTEFGIRRICGKIHPATSPVRGGMAERLKAPVLKTGIGQPIAGSNPAPSAIFQGTIGRS